MPERICFVGLDVHARRTARAAVQLGSGEVFEAQIPGPPVEAIEWLQTLPGPVRAVYEAGPTGFGLARAARAAGIEMMVCAPGAIPRQPGNRVKTDTRDALKLARLLAAGQLRPVVVPEPELEALRDLVRWREDLRGDLMACRHRISKLLFATRPAVSRTGRRMDPPARLLAQHAALHRAAASADPGRAPQLPRGAARPPRPSRRPHRRARHHRPVGAADRAAAMLARDRHADRDRTAH